MNFENMKVGSRLGIGFGMLIAALMIVSATAALRFQSLNSQIDDLVHHRMQALQEFNELKDNLNAIARAVRNVVLQTDPKDVAAEAQKIAPLQARNSELLAGLERSGGLPKVQELLKTISAVRPAYDRQVAEVVRLGESNTPEDAKTATGIITGPLRAQQTALFKVVDQSLALQQENAAFIGEQANQAVKAGLTLVASIAAAATALGLALAVLISRGITRQLGAEPADLSAAVGRVADGDLSVRLPLRSGGQDSVMAAVARMQQALTTVVSHVRQGSEAVASASTQIAQGNMDLSGRTESQASALEQTTASMEELNTTVQQNTDNARQAKQLAQNASDVAAQGGLVVAQVVGTMKDISGASRKIADIVGVIDGIAFQTNILALNAAVEAARAGEQGRGFAVVASEVRNLAGRSAVAAKEIKDLINDSVQRVEQGEALADRAGATMDEVVGAIRHVTDIMAEISSASVEQSGGVSQVVQAITTLDDNTQQNAALVEEMASAATALNEQAHDLVQAVAVFRLAHDSGAAPRAPRRRLPHPRDCGACRQSGAPGSAPGARARPKAPPGRQCDGRRLGTVLSRRPPSPYFRGIQMNATDTAAGVTLAGEYLSFRNGAEEYGIDILTVQEIRGYEAPTRIANAPALVLGVLNLRGAIVPILDMRIKLGMAEAAYGANTVTIVLSIAGRTVGMVVDAVSDVVELKAEEIKPAPEFGGGAGTRHILGIGTLAQGERQRMLILVDMDKLMCAGEIELAGTADAQ
jgi:methyl-accepting chemotaxis protein